MLKKIIIDPITRIEGHLRIEVEVDENNVVQEAWASGQLFRGIETILKGRDPRDAGLLAGRICGVCTNSHFRGAVTSVEDAYKIAVPKNAGGVYNWALKWIMKGGSINQMVKVFQLALEHQHRTATDVQLLTGQGSDYRFNISSTIIRADNLMCIHQMNGTMVVWSKDLLTN